MKEVVDVVTKRFPPCLSPWLYAPQAGTAATRELPSRTTTDGLRRDNANVEKASSGKH